MVRSIAVAEPPPLETFSPPAMQVHPEMHLLWVTGAVVTPAVYSAADLRGFPHVDIIEDFVCAEGRSLADQHWNGVPLEWIIAAARPTPGAHWVSFGAGSFIATLSLGQAREAILAVSLNDEPLTPERGGPMRLLVPGAPCYTSIKWLDRIEITVQPMESTARTAVIRRIASVVKGESTPRQSTLQLERQR